MKVLAKPLFDSPHLHEIASAIEGRGKAIRHHGKLQCSRFVEDTGERLNIDFTGINRFRIRLSIWSDGVFWLGITSPGPKRTGGWAHRNELHSKITNLEAHDILARFEQTIHSPTKAASFWPASE
jgi:hypothetical protein